MIKKLTILTMFFITGVVAAQAQVKVDGVAVVVGKNVVLESDIVKFKKEIEERSEGKAKISNCEMLEDIMLQKLLAHHAIIDSVEVSEPEVLAGVERQIAYFTQQLGSSEKVVEFFGFNDEADLRKELGKIERESSLIKKEQQKITESIDVTPEEVRVYFNSLAEKGNLPEFSTEIELAQIVLYAQPTEEEIKATIEKLNRIKKEIEGGSSFRMKAILNSDDPAVAQNGGQYTLTRESGFIKEFKEMAFSLDEGEISDPFKSDFGYHIVQVEKIKGQEIDVRHILIQPTISDEKLTIAKNKMTEIRNDILAGKITFEEAVKKYSEDKNTRNNNGLIMNPYTNDTHFDLTRMDPSLYARVSNLNAKEITEPFYDETREGEKMFKIILMKDKMEAHKADLVKDYVKIQRLTLQKKQEEAIDKWAHEKINDTYIKINEAYKKCEFKKNWMKNN